MGFFDKVKDAAGSAMAAASDAAKNVSDKGKEMTEKARVNKAIKAEETKINNLYMIMGQKLFNDNQTAPAGFENQFNGIRNAMAEIERLQNDLNSTVAASCCPQCGAKINPGQPFCQGCGTKLTASQPAAAPEQPVQATPSEEQVQPVQTPPSENQ